MAITFISGITAIANSGGGGSPSGPAGGDLSGTYPNPSIADTTVSAGTYGSSTFIPVFTVNSQGRLTSASVVSAAGGGSISIGDTIGGATVGSVLFAGTAGVLSQDNNNFFWNNTNKFLGIGVSANPAAALHLRSATTDTVANFQGQSGGNLQIEATDTGGTGGVRISNNNTTTGTIRFSVRNAAGSTDKLILNNLGGLTVQNFASTQQGLIIAGADSQSENMVVVRDSSAANLFVVGPTGNVSITGTVSASNLQGTNTGNVTLSGLGYLTIAGQTISAGAINLATQVSGNLPVTNLNSGTAASAASFWAGDGTWRVPGGGGSGTVGSGTTGQIAYYASNGTTVSGTDVIGATTPVQAQGYRPYNEQTGTTYTLVSSDTGKLVTLSNVSAITLTVPPNSTTAFVSGTEVDIVQIGAGQVTVAAGAGVTINSYNNLLNLAGRYAGGNLKKVGADRWLLIGNLA